MNTVKNTKENMENTKDTSTNIDQNDNNANENDANDIDNDDSNYYDEQNEDLEDMEDVEDMEEENDNTETKKELTISKRPKFTRVTEKNKIDINRYKDYKSRDKKNPQDQLYLISEKILSLQPIQNSEYEMEAKFGTRGIKQINKINYDNVIKKLKSVGFKCENESGNYSLKIQVEEISQGQLYVSGNFDLFRVEINDILNIQEYCKHNDIKSIISRSNGSVNVLQKYGVKETQNSEFNIDSADFDDFNFRVTLKSERTYSKTSPKIIGLFDSWNNKKKIFRYINRVTYINKENFPAFKVDISIVRSSNKNQYKKMIPTLNISDSNVFNNNETYEIEIEVINSIAKKNYITFLSQENQYVIDNKKLANDFQKVVRIVLSGLQETDYPVKYSEQNEVIQNYMKVLFEEEYKSKGENYEPKKYIQSSSFIGPSSVALQRQNITPYNSEYIIPNITKPYSYCVTDKADGERHLLYVNSNGKIYLINTNMNVIFTGAKTFNENIHNSILDGELITHDSQGNFINTYAAFDLYYVGGTDYRMHPFMFIPTDNEEIKESKKSKDKKKIYRLNLLQKFIEKLKPVHVNAIQSDFDKNSEKKYLSPMLFISKKFYPAYYEGSENNNYNIFENCRKILEDVRDKIVYNYEVDGLIFTPTNFGVGSNEKDKAGPKKKITWNYSFKWKPSEPTETFNHSYNTIDFLVKTFKYENNMDIITPIFENGVNMYEASSMKQFKTLHLCVGFNARDHGYINPCQDLLMDNYPIFKDSENENEREYVPKQFFPTDPYDLNAGIAHIMLRKDGNNTYQMFTEEGEIFTDDMIVEFKYDSSDDSNKKTSWKWTPLRVRYDKTNEYKTTGKNFGNSYNVANNTWNSMHYPITENMITTGQDIPIMDVSDDVYYNGNNNEKLTEAMRDFHNLYVKKKLILSVSRSKENRKGYNLIDFACGKGGDFPKWISAKLSFVLGIDISKDNIENRINGACARFLNFKKTDKNTPYALFVNGNSSLNIRSGINMATEKDNRIIKSVFAVGPNSDDLEPAIKRQYGVGLNGFNISSCQFAIHYMFKNKDTFYNFIQNVAECTHLNGHFIATTYDGNKVFNLLDKMNINEPYEKWINGKKIWSIQKNYDNNDFKNNETSLGYEILVYQDSINKLIPEYLVNYDFFVKTMEKYGFILVRNEECKQYYGFNKSSDTFDKLYSYFENEINRNYNSRNYSNKEVEKDYGKALDMTNEEKAISFLNRYYIFKKINNIDASRMTYALLNGVSYEGELNEIEKQREIDVITDIGKTIAAEEKQPTQIQTQELPQTQIQTQQLPQTQIQTNVEGNIEDNVVVKKRRVKVVKENEEEPEKTVTVKRKVVKENEEEPEKTVIVKRKVTKKNIQSEETKGGKHTRKNLTKRVTAPQKK